MKSRILYSVLFFVFSFAVFSQTYPPAAGQPGSTAIHFSDDLFVGWASGVEVERGYLNISNPDFEINGSNRASYGRPQDATGIPNNQVVSLGDGGVAVATFENPIADGPGFDFAVFENGFNDTYLELAFVEVSSNGIDFFRFPSHSLTQTGIQVGSFGELNPTELNNLAGKYRAMYGTPFDLAELENHPLLDKNRITHVKIIDVVGSIHPDFGTYDSFGNIINDPFPTPFESGGFDLDAIGVINEAQLSTENFKLSALKILPNPAVEYFYVTGISDVFNVKVFSAEGKMLKEIKAIEPEERIDVLSLPAGLYHVLIQAEKNTKLFKLLIQ